MAYYDPSLALIFRRLDQPGLHGSRYLWLGTNSHPLADEGPQPFTPRVRHDALRILSSVETSDSDRTVRAIAQFLVLVLPGSIK